MIASIKSVLIFTCSDPGLPVSILVIICGFQCGFVYAYNCAQLNKNAILDYYYSAVVMNEFSMNPEEILQQESGLAPPERTGHRGQDHRYPGSLPAAVWK